MITKKSSIIFFSILLFFIPSASAVFSGSYDMLNQDNASWDDSATRSRLARTLDWADVNGDGYADAIVGAYQNHSNAYGAVYILYGPQDNVTDVNIATKANVSLSGEGITYYLGSCIGSGDINGDGYDDLVLGSMYAGSIQEGRIYIIYGRSANIPSGNIGTVKNATINGTAGTSESLGIMCDTADVNGDGYDDVLAAARAFSNRGKTYLIYGKSTPFPGDDVITNVYNESWISGVNSDFAWVVRRAGDVNGDGYEDVLIGAPYYYNYGNGTVYLIYGQSAAFNQQNYTLPSGTNASFTGQTSTDAAGWSVSSAGDVDNDGYDDFLIAAPGYNSFTGRAYLFYGGAGTPWSGWYQVTSADATFTSINAGDQAGMGENLGGWPGSWPIGGGLSYGDFDFDGYSDFLVGVPDAGTNGRTNNGQVLLYYGQAARFSGNYLLNLTDADATFIGEASDYRMSALPTGMAKNVNRESILMGGFNINTGNSKGYEMFGDEPQPPPPPVVVVPEFSTTTLLLTILIAGGLIFAIRRHH